MRLVEDILVIIVLTITPNFFCEKLNLHRSAEMIKERRI